MADKKMAVISTANDENDDWLQKGNPQVYVDELRIHDELEEEYGYGAQDKETKS